MFCPFCGVNLPSVLVYCGSCCRNVRFLRSLQDEGPEASTPVDELIQKYFTEGHSYEIIVDLLKTKHNISVSFRNLQRRLKHASLTRRINYTPIATVQAAISEELKGSGQLLGYRAMWQILKQKHSLVVRRDDVMRLMAELDPCGTENRCRRRFVRRAYHSMGPNETWHVDGSQFWMDLFSDLRERHLFNGSPAHTKLVRHCFLRVLQKELDEYKLYWNTHTIRPVHQSRCPSGKPEAMYYVPQRFDGSNCGFPASAQTLNHITSIMPVPATPAGDEHETLFGELQRQSGVRAPLQWESAVENYITLKNMSGL
ncbi:uncharacterized protein LOC143004144 isoform X2 [Genypterus blacodes]|uniref:uncharacterized protein LOC142995185 isoform X2 n=1 Tax=Genypterus blacodes TaxID=154954 RepID=UPI003F7782AB